MTHSGGPGRDHDGTTGAADGTIVFHARQARVAGFVIGGVVLGAMVLAALVVPSSFTAVDRMGFLVVGLAIFAFCYREATVRVTAAPDHLLVRNLFRSRRLDWAEVISVSFPQGDPWAHLDLADGDTIATMALQRADGDRGIAAARRLAALVHERGESTDAPI